jgi:hypothetical protein
VLLFALRVVENVHLMTHGGQHEVLWSLALAMGKQFNYYPL